MSFTSSGVAILVIALYVFLRRPQRLMYYLIFFAPFSATAIVNLTALGYKAGGVGVTPAIVLSMLMCLAQLVYGGARSTLKVSTGHVVILAGILMFTIEMLGSLLFNTATVGVTSFQLTQTAYLMIGIVTTIVLSLKLARDENLEIAINVAKASAVFVSLWGMLQCACFFIGVEYPSILFNNSMSDSADMFDQRDSGFMRIASVEVEPSFFAASMLHFGVFGATLIMLEPRFRTRGWIFSVGLTLIALVISTSTTAYIGIAVFGLLMLLRKPLMTLVYGIPAVLVAAIGIGSVPKFRDTFLLMTIDKGSTSSYVDRVERMRESMEQFYNAPIIGQGWSKALNFNALATLLANTGLLGTVIAVVVGAALVYELGTVKPSPGAKDGWRLTAYAAGAQNMLIVSFICAVSSGLKYVVLDDACFGAIAIALLTRLAAARAQATPVWALPSGVRRGYRRVSASLPLEAP